MNLRDFQYIIAVSEQRNFTAAANLCAISQPTLSTQIRKLEDYLGVDIFDRQSNEISPTPVGEEIIALAKEILLQTETIKQIAYAAKHTKLNHVVLGAFPTLANYVFPEYVFRIKQHLPDINLRLIEEKTHILIELLLSGKLDIALLAMPVHVDSLSFTPLFEDEFYAAVPPDHPIAQQKMVDMDTLQTEKLMLLDEGHCLRTQIIKLCTAHQTHDDDFRAASLETLRMMVKNGLGITLMPSVAIFPDEPDINYIPIRSKPKREIGLFWLKNSPHNVFYQQFASLIQYKPLQ